MEVTQLLGLPTDELLTHLGASQSGLTSQEAQKRLDIYGHNELAKRKKRIVIIEFLQHFRSPLVITLLLAGLISGFAGEAVDAVLIFIMVFLSGVLDFY